VSTTPTDIVAYEFWRTTLCRDCLADVLGATPDAIEATLDRLSMANGLDRHDIVHSPTITRYTFPIPALRRDAERWSFDECTKCGCSLRLAPAIVRPLEVVTADTRPTPPPITTF